MLKFHALQVAQVTPDAEDAVALALEVPAALRSEYCGSAGQHVVRARHRRRRGHAAHLLAGERSGGVAAAHRAARACARAHVALPGGAAARRGLAGGAAAQRQLHPAQRPARGGGDFRGVRRRLRHHSGARHHRARCWRIRVARVMVFYGNSGSNRAMCLEELLSLKDLHLERLALHFLDEPRAAGGRAVQRPGFCLQTNSRLDWVIRRHSRLKNTPPWLSALEGGNNPKHCYSVLVKHITNGLFSARFPSAFR